MPKENTIVALDIGSSKFTVVVAVVGETKTSVIGTHTIQSSGIKDGVVNNIDEAVEAISEVLSRGEMMSGYPISKVIVTLSGAHIESLNSHGVVAVSGEDNEISPEDVARVNEAAQATSLPSTREIIHIIPREYIIDKQKGIVDPVGMTGFRLEVEANIVHGGATVIKNLSKSVLQVGVDIDHFIYSGYASSEAVLTETEKKLGCVCLDIGGGTIDMMVYQDSKPAYSAVLPIGGQEITNDLAIGLRTLLENAEKVKLKIAQEEDLFRKKLLLEKNFEDSAAKSGKLYVGDLNMNTDTVSKSLVNQIIHKRLEESFKFVQIYLKKAGFNGKLPAGVILTGGTANIKDIDQIAEKVFKVPSRVGKPLGLYGLVDQIQGAESSSVVGAILNESDRIKMNDRYEGTKGSKIRDSGNKMVRFLKSFLP